MMTRYLVALSAAAVLMGGSAQGADATSGWDAYNNGEYAKAYSLCMKAFREDPSNADVNYALGEAARKNKKYSHAVFAYDRVLMMEPDHERALLGKANALRALGQLEEAMETFSTLKTITADDALRSDAIAAMNAINSSIPKSTLNAKAFIAGIYDDNINYGNDDNVFSGFHSKETTGLEGGVDLDASYDLGSRKNWLLIGGFNLFNSWYEDASEQETANVRSYAGARRLGRNRVFEIVGRAERLWYGHAALVDIMGSDMAFMQRLSTDNSLITSATFEQRDYDPEFDPTGNRDSVYAKLGSTWKHFFDKPNTYLGLGGDLLLEDAHNDINSHFGYRIRLDGQMELPGSLLGYTGSRYRRLTYDDPDSVFMNEREDDRWDVFIGAKRKLTDQLTLDLLYLHVQNDSNMASNDYNRNRLTLTAIYDF